MNRLLLLLLLVLPTGLAAQGVLSGRVMDAAGGSEYLDEAAQIGVIALPETSPPFNELTATQWQHAFTRPSENAEPEIALGGVIAPTIPTASYFGEVQGDGSYRLEDLPLKTRLAVAARVGDMWWPLREEVWLTEASPELTKQINYFRLGADPAGVRIESYRMEVSDALRPDLRFALVRINETIRFVNPDPTRAAMVKFEMRVAMPPGSTARNLPLMFGSLLNYMQSWSATEPVSAPQEADNITAWTLGTGGGMHGGHATISPGAHTSADNWHRLNNNPMMALVGAGDTEYRVNPSANGRSASIVFNRPVPPALNGMPGTLLIKLAHNAGVLYASPGDKIAFQRSFNNSVIEASAKLAPELTMAALVEGAHRRLYGQPENNAYPSNPDLSPDLGSGETVQFVLSFTKEAQEIISSMAMDAKTPSSAPEPGEQLDKTPPFDYPMMFKALAVIFGLAFVGALVATVRLPRDKQLQRLAALPGTRTEVLEAVVELEREYKEGKLPATAYAEHRQRLLNRLVELDARTK